jgi:hypothetical protein
MESVSKYFGFLDIEVLGIQNQCIDTERSRRFDVMHCVDGPLLDSTYAISKEGAPSTSFQALDVYLEK